MFLLHRLGAMFFIAVTVVMSNIPGIELFSAQRTIFRHEVMSGYYHTLPYFLGRVAVDVLLFRMIPTAMLYTIAYYMIDFGGSFADLLFILLIGILSSVAGSSLAFFISSVILHPSSATVVLTMIFDIMMIFAGLLVNMKHMLKLFRWMQWLSIMRYGMEGLEIIVLEGERYCWEKVNGTCPSGPETVEGNAYIESQGFDLERKWFDVMALFIWIVLFLTLTYLRLRFMKKTI
jgi:ATP-binding cassette subfamily G (WHITE) protein 2